MWKKNFFFFFNIKLYYDLVYLCYKNQDHLRSGGKSLKNQGFWRHMRQKKNFFFNIKSYYDVVYLYYKNKNHRRSIGLWKTRKTRVFGNICDKNFFLQFFMFLFLKVFHPWLLVNRFQRNFWCLFIINW